MAAKELQLVSVASVPSTFLGECVGPIGQVLGLTAFVAPVTLPKPTFAFNKDRQQYHTAAVMRRLLTLKPPGVPHIMGICDVDLFVPDSSFVYGEADRESHVALMSLLRLRGDSDAHRRRTLVEVVHLAGHLVGLSYCEDPRCAMFLATTITDAERRQLSLCSNCRNELVRLRKR